MYISRKAIYLIRNGHGSLSVISGQQDNIHSHLKDGLYSESCFGFYSVRNSYHAGQDPYNNLISIEISIV